MNYSKEFYIPNPFNKYISPYEKTFYINLLEYHQGGYHTALDIGCGTGIVSVELSSYFDNVIGIDKDPGKIKEAIEINEKSFQKTNLKYLELYAENLDGIGDGSVDLITCAQSCHCFEHALFYKECLRILKPGGTLAIWLYIEPHIIDSDKAMEIFTRYYHTDMGLEQYWEYPSNIHLRSKLVDKAIPDENFVDIIKKEYHPKMSDPDPELSIHRIFNLKDFASYLRESKAYQNWLGFHKVQLKNMEIKDLFDQMVSEFEERLDWNLECEFKVIWDTMFTLGRKI